MNFDEHTKAFLLARVKPTERFKLTRYFVFFKVKPTDGDYARLIKSCKKIHATVGYSTIFFGGSLRLIGFFILRGPRARVHMMVGFFPNFIVTVAPGEVDLDRVPCDVLLGCHPYLSIRRDLFS